MIQVKISNDIMKYESKSLFGFTPRQLGCTLLAIVLALTINLGLTFIPKDIRGYITVPLVAPLIACGWLKLQGMNFEKYALLFIKRNFSNNKRVFMNENLFHYVNSDKRINTSKKKRRRNRGR